MERMSTRMQPRSCALGTEPVEAVPHFRGPGCGRSVAGQAGQEGYSPAARIMRSLCEHASLALVRPDGMADPRDNALGLSELGSTVGTSLAVAEEIAGVDGQFGGTIPMRAKLSAVGE